MYCAKITNRKSMSLPEVVVSMALIALVMLSFMEVYHLVLSAQEHSQKQQTVVALAEKLMSEIDAAKDGDSFSADGFLCSWQVTRQWSAPIDEKTMADIDQLILTITTEGGEQSWQFITSRKTLHATDSIL